MENTSLIWISIHFLDSLLILAHKEPIFNVNQPFLYLFTPLFSLENLEFHEKELLVWLIGLSCSPIGAVHALILIIARWKRDGRLVAAFFLLSLQIRGSLVDFPS